MKSRIKTFSAKYNSEVKHFLLDILEGEFGHNNIERPDLENMSSYYQINKGNFWIALYEGQLIGTIGLKDHQGVAYIKRMAVRKEYRGQGIAQKLLATLTKYAREREFYEIYLSTSQNLVAANKFYSKEGFKNIEKLPVEIPEQIAQIHYMKNIS